MRISTTLTMVRPMILMLLAVSLDAFSAVEADPLFASNEPLAITVTGPIRSISRDNTEFPEYQPGTLGFSQEGEPRTVDIRIRPRGKSRRELCAFPPLRLNLPKKAVADTVFAEQDKLKLVTHCQSGTRGHQYLLREYLAYRILNLLTPNSFKVRLVNIEYVDNSRDGKSMTHPGFFIEHKSRLAKRRDAKLAEFDRLQPDQLDPAATSLAELFQYLISNTDFSFVAGPVNDLCCHNSVLLHANEAGRVLPVPYDFDVSGVVDAPYAVPALDSQRSVRDRVFRGFCRPDPYLADAVAKAQAVRKEVFSLIDVVPGLNDRNRQRVVAFVEDFYKTLDDERRFNKEIGGACRKLG